VRLSREIVRLFFAQDLEPAREVRRLSLAQLGRDVEIRTQESGTQPGDDLFTPPVSPKRLPPKSRLLSKALDGPVSLM
jgi:hypothetical protein